MLYCTIFQVKEAGDTEKQLHMEMEDETTAQVEPYVREILLSTTM